MWRGTLRWAGEGIRAGARGLKTELPVEWTRPERLSAYTPVKAGDLEPAPTVSPHSAPLAFQRAPAWQDAPESVRKIFSVAYLGGREANMLARQELMDRVKRHKYDEMTAESRIARITATIRCLQEHMAEFPREVHGKKTCQELIDKRKKLLKFMRVYDYKRFEWLLEKLNIEYKAAPETWHKLSRKESLRKLTELHCEEIKNKKLTDYRNLLESQQGPFLRDKLAALQTIQSEQHELQLEVTVNEQDIKRVEDALRKWTIKDEIKQKSMKPKKKRSV